MILSTTKQNKLANQSPWLFVALLAILIGLYPGIYLFVPGNFGLLGSKPESLLQSVPWKTAFILHITCGGIALLTGWPQFSQKWRTRNLNFHRQLGKVYVIAVLTSATAGFYLALFATGGIIASTGFVLLALTWFITTYLGYVHARAVRIDQHRRMMIYSYACSFAAVTLRIWLPLLAAAFGDFIPAYLIVAWLCWVPNLGVAWLLIRRGRVAIQSV